MRKNLIFSVFTVLSLNVGAFADPGKAPLEKNDSYFVALKGLIIEQLWSSIGVPTATDSKDHLDHKVVEDAQAALDNVTIERTENRIQKLAESIVTDQKQETFWGIPTRSTCEWILGNGAVNQIVLTVVSNVYIDGNLCAWLVEERKLERKLGLKKGWRAWLDLGNPHFLSLISQRMTLDELVNKLEASLGSKFNPSAAHYARELLQKYPDFSVVESKLRDRLSLVSSLNCHLDDYLDGMSRVRDEARKILDEAHRISNEEFRERLQKYREKSAREYEELRAARERAQNQQIQQKKNEQNKQKLNEEQEVELQLNFA
jgi:hypothetical protein